MTNIVEKLSREMERVTAMRERWCEENKVPRGRMALLPGIAMMTEAIEAGHTAAGRGDPIEIIEAIKRLEDFKE